MKKLIFLSIFMLLFTAHIFGQTKNNDAIERQIKNLRLAQTFRLTYNSESDMSKIMAFAEDFGGEQDKRAKVQGFSFGMAFFFQGKTLSVAPDPINLTFWVKTKKPQFAEAHHLTIYAGTETLDLGDARYAAKPNENMEYLNFKFPREVIEKIGKSNEAKIKIGNSEFIFTPEHLKVFSAMTKISNPSDL